MKLYRFGHPLGFVVAVLCLATFHCGAAWALEPDEILLVTNKNSPDSQKLAALYAQLRNIPPDQVIALDLPDSEEMPFNTYETAAVAPLRKFIADHQLQTKVKCLLTFYGVPFRIHARENTPADDLELSNLNKLQETTTQRIQQTVTQLETDAGGLDASFKPGVGDSVPALLARGQAAIAAISPKIETISDPIQRQNELRQIETLVESMRGTADADGKAQMRQLQETRWDPDSRRQMLLLAQGNFGLVGSLRVIEAETNYLTPEATAAATDNELALLWFDYYPRQRWAPNPLNFAFTGGSPQALMVMRLDGPDPATVEKMMRTSVEVEKTGLSGIIALDARGLSPIDAKGNPDVYGQFDDTIRNLAYLVRTKTDLKIRLDDQDLVFPAHSVKNVALYVGWYSVNRYIPGCDFNPGAVGYHIASYEMVTLHTPSSYWVRGLLTDGVVATLGPVAEPYLTAFPRPDEFFPLLLTGKLTLAEVYWKTTPMTSWMISFIGDPLYTPYKMHPAMKVEDLPPRLRRAVDGLPPVQSIGATDSSHQGN